MKNRLVALPVHTGFAHTDGRVSSWMMDFYTRLADSGVAMVIVANTTVAHDGAVSRFNLRADNDRFIPGLSRLAKRIKQKGAIACLQLNHAGRFAKTERPLLPSPITSSNLSFNVESLKGFMEFFPFEKRFNLTRYLIKQVKTWRGAMTAEDRERVIHDFAQAAFRAYQAGFDMVELHGANGYLLCQYLSPFTNKIKSGFGGEFQERAAFPLAVIRKVKEKVPEDFPVGFRLLLREWVPDGIDLPEALAFATLMENEGIAYLSASVGTYNSILSPPVLKEMAKTAYLKQDMAQLTDSVTIPTIISGRVTTPSCADELIRDNTADLIGLGRPLRTDMGWVAKAGIPHRKIIKCINCNWCLKRVVLEKGFNCRCWPKLHRERTKLEHKLLTRNYMTLWIITNMEEMQTFKKSLPLLILKREERSRLTIVFLRRRAEEQSFDTARRNFIKWTQNNIEALGFADTPQNYIVKESPENWEKAVNHEISQGNHGQVVICSNRDQPWRERFFHKERGKVLLRLNPNSRLHRVIVPVDLSDITLLVMIFLRRNHMAKKDFKFNFVHVVTERSGREKQRWKELKKIAGLNENIPLELISVKTDVAATLINTIEVRGYGTVVMGKRGLSGIKRWLLGSVSAGVLKKLTDHSLFLID